jgi:hypothetical protein
MSTPKKPKSWWPKNFMEWVLAMQIVISFSIKLLEYL